MLAMNRKLFRDVWHMKGQALAIALVMAAGVTIVIMTFGAMTSLKGTRDTYYERNEFADVFSQLRRAPLSFAPEIARIPGIRTADTRITHYAALDIPGMARPASALLVSLPEAGEPRLNKITLQSGRLPRHGRDELVMSQNMASALSYGPGSKLSVIMGGRKRLFTVSGVALSPEFVYVLAPGQLMPDDKAFGILWLDRPLMEAAFDMKGAFNDVSIRLDPGASEPEVLRRLDLLLARYGGTAAYGREDQTSHAFITQELNQLQTIAFVIPPVFLAVSAFLINMVLLRMIATEREAIGLFKSFGYADWEIGWHYLKFTLIIASLGVALGIGAGVTLGRWMTGLYQDYFRFPFLQYRLDGAVLTAAVLVSFGAAILGALSAVMRAAKLAPAIAMLPPAPPIYRRGLLDRLGLERRISVPGQMIVRHIERWPLRALFTLSGVAMAAMLLVTLFFFFDAIDELVDQFYFRANHQDVVIGLTDQRGERGLYDVARLPGVIAAEPVREAAARLSHGHLSQRVGLTGLMPSSRFRAFHDAAGRSFTLPGRGLLLSNKLASLLDLRAGDMVKVDILEGARHSVMVPVSAIASEDVGLSAYMDQRSLAALTGEPDSLTSLQVSLDGAMMNSFLARLKEIPSVGTVSTRAQAVASLRETLAKSMIIVINFYIGLGAVIAFGVVYNAARISLSERGRELASLRVMGFSRGEVGYILLGELALLVLAALPVGCLMGYGLAHVMASAMETKLFRVPFVVLPSTYGIAMSIVLASAAASALMVGWRVGRLDLIAVLKTRE